MKHFKNLNTFERELKKGLCWEDYFKVGRKTFKIYEYGGGSMMGLDYDYIYFYNKYSKMMIYIEYDGTSYKYENGIKIKTKQYRFIKMEISENPFLWRKDTL